MYKVLIFLFFATAISRSNATEPDILEDVSNLVAEDKSGSLTLSNSNTNSFLSNAIYVVPVLLAIILVDFAIFGAFASRSDDLNPISNFFYHVKRGLSIVQDRGAVGGRPSHYNRHRYTRSPVLTGYNIILYIIGGESKYIG